MKGGTTTREASAGARYRNRTRPRRRSTGKEGRTRGVDGPSDVARELYNHNVKSHECPDNAQTTGRAPEARVSAELTRATHRPPAAVRQVPEEGHRRDGGVPPRPFPSEHLPTRMPRRPAPR